MERFTEIVTDSKGRKAKIEYTAESRWPLTDAPCEWPRRGYIYATPPTCKSTNDPDFSLTEWFVKRYLSLRADLKPEQSQESIAYNKARAILRRARKRFNRLQPVFMNQETFDRLADADGLGYIVPGFKI